MARIKVDFNQRTGKVKPMHAVNNGPVYKFAVDQRITNIDDYRAAGIPFARNHDAAFYSTYGGERFTPAFRMPNLSSYLIKIKKL